MPSGLPPIYLRNDVAAALSIAALRDTIAARVGVPAEYITLFQPDVALDTSHRVAARVPSTRIDAAIAPSVSPYTHPREYMTAMDAITAQLGRQSLEQAGVPSGGQVQALIRPLRGDHIHHAFAMYVGGRRLAHPVDRAMQGYTSEGQHLLNVFPHFGVHAGGAGWFQDGILHIHPGTSWSWFTQSEGLGATLGMFLESIGIVVWGRASWRYPGHRPFPTMPDPLSHTCIDSDHELVYADERGDVVINGYTWESHEYAAGHTVLCDNATHVWRAYVWRSVLAHDPSNIVEDGGLDRIWLGAADSMISLSFESRNGSDVYEGVDYSPPMSGSGRSYPFPAASTVKVLRNVPAEAFDGGTYPRLHVAMDAVALAESRV